MSSEDMVGQIIADLKYMKRLRHAEDWWSWACPGPGSRRGLNRVLGRAPEVAWTNGNWFSHLTALRREIRPLIKAAQMPKIHAQDLQNCLCEYDKYERERLGQGHPKSRYAGVA